MISGKEELEDLVDKARVWVVVRWTRVEELDELVDLLAAGRQLHLLTDDEADKSSGVSLTLRIG